MRMRRRKFRASVQVQAGPSPIVLGFGPALTFEAGIAEAVHLVEDLIGAIEQARRGGASEC